MEHSEDYKGHHLSVSTYQRGNGYAWEYLIDGHIHRSQIGDRPMSENIALAEGIDAAKSYVDQMLNGK